MNKKTLAFWGVLVAVVLIAISLTGCGSPRPEPLSEVQHIFERATVKQVYTANNAQFVYLETDSGYKDTVEVTQKYVVGERVFVHIETDRQNVLRQLRIIVIQE